MTQHTRAARKFDGATSGMIVPYRGGAPKRTTPALIQFASNGIAADVRLDGVDHRGRRHYYVVRLVASGGAISGRLLSVDSRGRVVELGVLDVSPYSVSSSRFLVTRQSGADPGSVFLEIRGPDLLLKLEAPALPGSKKRSPRIIRVGAGAIALGMTAFASALIALGIFPRVSIAAPNQATAGDMVRIAYDFSGAGVAKYSASSADGGLISTGMVSDPHGQISFAVPIGHKNHQVTVRLDVAGLLGSASRSQSFNVVPPIRQDLEAPARLARIASLSARREPTFGGETVLASYLVVADGGELTMTDNQGRIVARGQFQRAGSTRFPVPPEFIGQPLNLQLHIRRGLSVATTSVVMPPAIPVAIAGAVAAAAVPRPALKGATDDINAPPESIAPAQDASGQSGDDPFAVIGSPIGGTPMQVRINRAVTSMHLNLVDEAGLAIDEVTVPSRATKILLRTPFSSVSRTYYLTCSYDSGSGVEVLVRSVRVASR